MFAPIQISLHGIAPSKALQKSIVEKAGKLERVYDRIVGCRVVLMAEGHQRQGKQFCVHIGVKVPGSEIAVSRQHDEDVHVALREAFGAARRSLEDYVREKRDFRRTA